MLQQHLDCWYDTAVMWLLAQEIALNCLGECYSFTTVFGVVGDSVDYLSVLALVTMLNQDLNDTASVVLGPRTALVFSVDSLSAF